MAGVPPLEATSLILDSEKARLVKAVVANTHRVFITASLMTHAGLILRRQNFS
jgi:hypothetical protein